MDPSYHHNNIDFSSDSTDRSFVVVPSTSGSLQSHILYFPHQYTAISSLPRSAPQGSNSSLQYHHSSTSTAQVNPLSFDGLSHQKYSDAPQMTNGGIGYANFTSCMGDIPKAFPLSSVAENNQQQALGTNLPIPSLSPNTYNPYPVNIGNGGSSMFSPPIFTNPVGSSSAQYLPYTPSVTSSMLPPTTWSEPGSLLPTPNSSPPFSTDTPSFSISHPHVPPVREINLTRPHHLNHLSVPQGSPKLIDRPRATTSVSPAPRKQRSPRSGGATKGLSTSAWEDEGTNVYQLEVNDVLLTRRMDNDRINGTKLLNIAALTRGRRDGILKNERPREVIKHGAMHLKGVWIELERARALAYTHNIYPLVAMILSDTPDEHLYDPEASASLGATRWNPRGDASSSTDDEASSTGGCSTDLRDLPVNPYGDWRV